MAITRYQALKTCLKLLGIHDNIKDPMKLVGKFKTLDTYYESFGKSFSMDKLDEEEKELEDHLLNYRKYLETHSNISDENDLAKEMISSYRLGIALEIVDILLVTSYLYAKDLITLKDVISNMDYVKKSIYNFKEYDQRIDILFFGKANDQLFIDIIINYKVKELTDAINVSRHYKCNKDIRLKRYYRMFLVLYPEKDIRDINNIKLIRKFIFTEEFQNLEFQMHSIQ